VSAHSELILETPQGDLRRGTRPLIMAVLNVTPDSFSDGGRYADPAAAADRAVEMVADGAEVIDVGGESTRPGCSTVPTGEQLRRVLPVIQAVRQRCPTTLISIDTQSATVAAAALDGGAAIVNDISALRGDAAMAEACARRGAAIVLMHMQGTPETMQRQPHYEDVVAEVADFLRLRAAAAVEAGISPRRICIDPGIGFGKTGEHNLRLLASLSALRAAGLPLLVGASRKAFIGAITGEPDPVRRDAASAVVAAWCAMQDVFMVRVHDVQRTRQALDLIATLQRG